MTLREINSINPIDRFNFINNFKEDDLTHTFVNRMWSGGYDDTCAKDYAKERLKSSPDDRVKKVDKLDRKIRSNIFMAVVFAVAAVALFALTLSTGEGVFLIGCVVAEVLTYGRYESIKKHTWNKKDILNEIPIMREKLKVKVGENLNKITKLEKNIEEIEIDIAKIESEPDITNEDKEKLKNARNDEMEKLSQQIAEDNLWIVRWSNIWDKIDEFLKAK